MAYFNFPLKWLLMPKVAYRLQFMVFNDLLSAVIVKVRVLTLMSNFLKDENGFWYGHYDSQKFSLIVFATAHWNSLLKSWVILQHSNAGGTLHNVTMISPGTNTNMRLQYVLMPTTFLSTFFPYYFLTQNNWNLKYIHEFFLIQINYQPYPRPGRIQGSINLINRIKNLHWMLYSKVLINEFSCDQCFSNFVSHSSNWL